tara:strand:- start:514 stop:660 length:147 start_codon:yes stop_codon:yes gene_type:complete
MFDVNSELGHQLLAVLVIEAITYGYQPIAGMTVSSDGWHFYQAMSKPH